MKKKSIQKDIGVSNDCQGIHPIKSNLRVNYKVVLISAIFLIKKRHPRSLKKST